MMKVSVSTLGCKSNQYDSSALEDILERASFVVVPFPSPADAYIINTCTVTAKTDSQSRQLIRKARKINPEAIVIVTGCYAQVSPDEVSRIEGVDYILGNPEKDRVVEYLLKGRQRDGAAAVVGHYKDGTPLGLRAAGASGRTRANLKVQEGCNRACSYCIIPRARGASKSLVLKDVEMEIDALVYGSSYREIVFTGIHLGAWGSDLNPPADITSLLRLIEKKDYPSRFRLSSLDPDEATDGLIEVLKGAKRVCNHVHLALQSGDDAIIKAMRRPYTAGHFADRVTMLVKEVPEIAIGVDVIAGFPGEGEKEFKNTFSLLKALPVAYLHIFPFSKRRGVPASQLSAQVSPKVIKDRCARLKELDALKREEFYKRSVGKDADVLVESTRDRSTGLLKGRARNYIPVSLEGGDALRGTIAKVSLTGFDGSGMRGQTAV